MNADIALDICRRALETGVLVLTPLLLSALLSGVLAGLLQAVTQIQEPTVSFVPKVLALSAAMLFFGPFMIDKIRVFTVDTIGLIGALHR